MIKVRLCRKSCRFLLFLIFYGLLINPAWGASRTVVLTIDDFPSVGPRTRSVLENVQRLATHISTAGISGTAFVVGARGNLKNMKPWIDAGLPLANHTLSHWNYSKKSIKSYLNDIKKNEEIVKKRLGIDMRGSFFRFPYLDHGNTKEKVDAVAVYMKTHGYTIAHVSLDTVDYRFAQYYTKSKSRKQVGDLYLKHVQQCAEHFSKLSQRLYEREIPLILLVHANELNADMLGLLIKQFQDNHYTWISLAEAVEDEAYKNFRYRPPLIKCKNDRNFLNQVALSRGLYLSDPSGDRYFRNHWLPKITRLKP